MAEAIQLAELIQRVQVEAKLSLNATHGISQRATIIGQLNRAQRGLAATTDWDELETHQVVVMVAGTWIYDFPNNMIYEKVRKVIARDGATVYDVDLGFGPKEFAQFDPTLDQRDWPIRRWRLATGSINSFEVWPEPSIAASLDMLGQKIVPAMVEDDDFCTLDADVLSLRVAGSLLARDNPQDARLKFDAADQRIITLRADQTSNKGEDVVLGGGLRRQFFNEGI